MPRSGIPLARMPGSDVQGSPPGGGCCGQLADPRAGETKAGYPRQWLEAADDSDYLTYVTPQELQQLNRELHAVLERFWDRLTDPAKRPPGALPVETLLLSYPIEPPVGHGDPRPPAGGADRPG
jgi:hypothetical protein